MCRGRAVRGPAEPSDERRELRDSPPGLTDVTSVPLRSRDVSLTCFGVGKVVRVVSDLRLPDAPRLPFSFFSRSTLLNDDVSGAIR
jgi:hypothetical protein